MKKLLFILFATSLPVTAAGAQTTIDFEEFAFDGGTGSNNTMGSPFTTQGFTFSAPDDPFGLDEFNVFGRQSTNNADFGGAAIVPNRSGNLTTFARTDGSLFDFSSIDLTFAFDDQNGSFSGGDVTFFFDGSPTGQTVSFDTMAGFETFNFNALGLSSVAFSSTNSFAFDNIVIGSSAAAVPEPGTWAMMLLGFGATGFAMRRRRSLVAAKA